MCETLLAAICVEIGRVGSRDSRFLRDERTLDSDVRSQHCQLFDVLLADIRCNTSMSVPDWAFMNLWTNTLYMTRLTDTKLLSGANFDAVDPVFLGACKTHLLLLVEGNWSKVRTNP